MRTVDGANSESDPPDNDQAWEAAVQNRLVDVAEDCQDPAEGRQDPADELQAGEMKPSAEHVAAVDNTVAATNEHSAIAATNDHSAIADRQATPDDLQAASDDCKATSDGHKVPTDDDQAATNDVMYGPKAVSTTAGATAAGAFDSPSPFDGAGTNMAATVSMSTATAASTVNAGAIDTVGADVGVTAPPVKAHKGRSKYDRPLPHRHRHKKQFVPKAPRMMVPVASELPPEPPAAPRRQRDGNGKGKKRKSASSAVSRGGPSKDPHSGAGGRA